MKRIIILTAALFLLSSCTAEIDQTLNGIRSDAAKKKTMFYATTESSTAPSPATKVYADSQMRVLWNAGDQITIFNQITYNQGFEFDGEDGDTAGGFESFTEDPTFGSWGDLNYAYAVYPYDTKNKCDYDGILTVTLPQKQTYKENSFGIGANTMVAVTDNSRLQFKNVGGYLSLRLYGDNVAVSKITIQGNNNEKIAGKANVTIPFGELPSTAMDNSATDVITLVCNPAVQLGTDAEHYTDFWFVIPPVTFSNGFTITVTDSQGGVFEKTTNNSLTVVRNQLDWMDPLEVVTESNGSGEVTAEDLAQLSNVINQFISTIENISVHPYMTYNDSTQLWFALREFSLCRESYLKYVFNPATNSRDRRYFKYCTGYSDKPIIDSILFSDITFRDVRSHVFDLTTTCIDDYNQGIPVYKSVFQSLCLQLFNSTLSAIFETNEWGELETAGLIEDYDMEAAINADNYNAFFGRYRYDASLESVVPLYNESNIHILFEDATVKQLCLSNWDAD